MIDLDIDCQFDSLTADTVDLCTTRALNVTGPFTIKFTTGSFTRRRTSGFRLIVGDTGNTMTTSSPLADGICQPGSCYCWYEGEWFSLDCTQFDAGVGRFDHLNQKLSLFNITDIDKLIISPYFDSEFKSKGFFNLSRFNPTKERGKIRYNFNTNLKSHFTSFPSSSKTVSTFRLATFAISPLLKF